MPCALLDNQCVLEVNSSMLACTCTSLSLMHHVTASCSLMFTTTLSYFFSMVNGLFYCTSTSPSSCGCITICEWEICEASCNRGCGCTLHWFLYHLRAPHDHNVIRLISLATLQVQFYKSSMQLFLHCLYMHAEHYTDGVQICSQSFH
jgi:hypothetical protein